MIVQAMRSLVFYVLFLGQTMILAISLGIAAPFVSGYFSLAYKVGVYWARSNLFFLRWITGIRSEVTGIENIPEGGCIIAAKHQSDWDIFAILPHTGRPAFIAKKELMTIPFFGKVAQKAETISIDRQKGAKAIPAMIEDARSALSRGCRIVIFPEGHRMAPLEAPNYRAGTVRLYEALGVPVVPVALNSGLFWGRNSLVLWPGKARARFLPPIEPGLDAETFRKRLVDDIETASSELIRQAAREGLTRPIPPALRAKLDALDAGDGPGA